MLFQRLPPANLTAAESFSFATVATGAMVFAISFACRWSGASPAREKVYEFALVLQPLKLRGFSGSTVAPTAFR